MLRRRGNRLRMMICLTVIHRHIRVHLLAVVARRTWRIIRSVVISWILGVGVVGIAISWVY